MTTETSTTAISSISGSNSNIHGGANVSKQSQPPPHQHHVQKRTFHQFETEKNEQQNSENSHPRRFGKLSSQLITWLFCSPCIHFLKTSTTFHKMTITGITLIVTALLVVSPIIFLISAAPNMPTKCDDCFEVPPPECQDPVCKSVASSIQAKIDWNVDFCNDFKSFSCSSQQNSLKIVKTPQEIADNQMLQLLSQNTTTGMFRKLGRFYESCLRQELNSSSIRLAIEDLGGYIPISHMGPSSSTTLLRKMMEMGAPPILFDVYYDLSYGKKPQVLLIVDIPTDVHQILQDSIRWKSPRAPSLIGSMPVLLDEMLNFLLPSGMSIENRETERQSMLEFISQLIQMRKDYIDRDFSNSHVVNNISALMDSYPFDCLKFHLSLSDLLPQSWSGPVVIKNQNYIKALKDLLASHPTRVVHNSLLLIFTLNILPNGIPSPLTCTKATMAQMPEASSALFMSQFTDEAVRDAIARASDVFDLLKAHLKRAPSLRGFALVRLASLKFQAEPWPALMLFNKSHALEKLNELDITSDNWFENVLRIYKHRRLIEIENITSNESQTWAFPTISKAFYEPLSHKIVVPLSLILVPYFHPHLPAYLHYSTVGNNIAKEILRSVTKAFEDKAIKCVPPSVEVFSNSSRMELLISSGGMQIAYHSMLTFSGSKAMERLPGINNLSSTQLFFLVTAQELCSKSAYEGVETDHKDFHDILLWLIAQGGKAGQHFECRTGSEFRKIQNCGIW